MDMTDGTASPYKLGIVLVTGGSGRLGRYVIAEVSRRYTVINADLVAASGPGQLHLDVLNLPDVVDACQSVDAVVHLAALDYDTHASSERFIAVNTVGTWNVLQACASVKVRNVIACSSVAALGLHESRDDWTPLGLPVDETHEARPAQAYGVSKLIVETMAMSFVRAHSMNVLCLRPAAIIFAEELNQFMTTVDPVLPSLFDYVTAGDVAIAVAQALDHGWTGFELATLCADDTAHPDPTLEWYRRLIGPVPELVEPTVFETDTRASIYSNRRAGELFGWRPTSDFEAIRASHCTREGQAQ